MRWMVLAAGLAGCAPSGAVVVSGLPPQPFCTRTLGVAQCFAYPAALPDHPHALLDTPVRAHVECAPWWFEGGLVCAWAQPDLP